jgi:hypothetical protein
MAWQGQNFVVGTAISNKVAGQDECTSSIDMNTPKSKQMKNPVFPDPARNLQTLTEEHR